MHRKMFFGCWQLTEKKISLKHHKCLNVVIATDKTFWKLFFEFRSMDILYDLLIEAKIWIWRKIISIQSKPFSSINLASQAAHWWRQKMTKNSSPFIKKFNRDERRIFSFRLALKIIFNKNLYNISSCVRLTYFDKLEQYTLGYVLIRFGFRFTYGRTN